MSYLARNTIRQDKKLKPGQLADCQMMTVAKIGLGVSLSTLAAESLPMVALIALSLHDEGNKDTARQLGCPAFCCYKFHHADTQPTSHFQPPGSIISRAAVPWI
jgi:hypothetical protein